ncbi:hypothetical protein HWI79_1581 [Cryptosporidium felis]|nr:hypothetical protein HWI79_1581 [Cryptosporidium felis]
MSKGFWSSLVFFSLWVAQFLVVSGEELGRQGRELGIYQTKSGMRKRYPDSKRSIDLLFGRGVRNEDNKRLNKLLGSLELGTKDKDQREDAPEFPRRYFSFREAEEHSDDDVDLEGIFDSNYGGRARITEHHRISPGDIYIDEFKPPKYEFAVGASLRDKYHDEEGRSRRKDLVLVITPKDYFADRDGKLLLLPSLALKINRNSTLSDLLKKIDKLISKAHPNVKIVKVRHLRTKVILSEAPMKASLSSLRIKDGDEISATYKTIPAEESPSGSGQEELPDIQEELPITPAVGDLEPQDLYFKEGDLMFEKEETQKKDLNGLQEYAPSEVFVRNEGDLNIGENDNQLVIHPEVLPSNSNDPKSEEVERVEDKYKMSDEEVEIIGQEKGIEAEKVQQEEIIVDISPEVEVTVCRYRVYFKRDSSAGKDSKDSKLRGTQDELIAIKDISLSELGPCSLGSLISEINKYIRSSIQGEPTLKKLVPISSRTEIDVQKADNELALIDLGVLNGDEISAHLLFKDPEAPLLRIPTSKEDLELSEDEDVIVYAEENKDQIQPKKCQVLITVYLESESRVSKETSSTQEKTDNTVSKRLKPITVCAKNYISIRRMINVVKSKMMVNSKTEGIFICGEEIIDSKSKLPVAFIESNVCALRFEL